MSARSGSEKRYRDHMVGVRLTEREYMVLTVLAERTGGTAPQLLRESFFASPLAEIEIDP